MVADKSNGVLRTADVAALLGVSPAALRMLEERGTIPPAPRDQFGRRVFAPALVKSILNRRRVPGESEHE